jgi:hypothetical protein
MATAVYAFGPAKISINSGASGAWEEVGYTAEGVRVREEEIMIPVPGDENGGPEGAPIEFQHLSAQHFLTLELTKFDAAVLQKLRSRFKSGLTAGLTKAPGALVGTDFFRVLLESDTDSAKHRRYLKVYVTQPIEETIGTKYSRPVVVLMALPVKYDVSGTFKYGIWDAITANDDDPTT